MRKKTMLGRGSAANVEAGMTNEPRRIAKLRMVCFMSGLLSCRMMNSSRILILMKGTPRSHCLQLGDNTSDEGLRQNLVEAECDRRVQFLLLGDQISRKVGSTVSYCHWFRCHSVNIRNSA